MAAWMAVCVPVQLVLVMNDSAFGWVGKDEAIGGEGLVIMGWVGGDVRYWPDCWVRVVFLVSVVFRASAVVARMERVSVAYMAKQCVG